MTQKHNTSGYPKAATTDYGDVAGAAFINSHETALTRFAGTSDPSTSAPTAWGANEVGYLWLDTTDANSPVLKQWQQLTAGPTYGWRSMRSPKLKWLETPFDAVASTTSATDVGYTDVDLTASLDSSGQDAGAVLPTVRLVCLRIMANCTVGAIPAGDTGFVKVRGKGFTDEHKVHALVAAKPVYQQVWVSLDTGETFQYGVDTNAGAVTMGYEIKVMGFIEPG